MNEMLLGHELVTSGASSLGGLCEGALALMHLKARSKLLCLGLLVACYK
jgi:hypothetical protein